MNTLLKPPCCNPGNIPLTVRNANEKYEQNTANTKSNRLVLVYNTNENSRLQFTGISAITAGRPHSIKVNVHEFSIYNPVTKQSIHFKSMLKLAADAVKKHAHLLFNELLNDNDVNFFLWYYKQELIEELASPNFNTDTFMLSTVTNNGEQWNGSWEVASKDGQQRCIDWLSGSCNFSVELKAICGIKHS